MRAFSGVEELEVEVFQASYGTSDFSVLELFQGIRGVGRARVFGRVTRGFATWLERCMESPVGDEVKGFGEVWAGDGGTDGEVLMKYELWTQGGR